MTWQRAVDEVSTHCHHVYHPRRGLVRRHDLAGPDGIGDGRGGPRQGSFGPRQHVAQGTLADREAEHLAHQPGQPLKADRLRHVQMHHQGHDPGSEGAAGRQPLGRRRAEAAATARAGAAMPMHAGHDGPDRRQIDVVVGVKILLVLGRQGMVAMRAGCGRRRDGMVGRLAQGSEAARTPLGLRGTTVRPVRLLPPARRHRRVVGCLGWKAELGLQGGDAVRQSSHLCRALRQRLSLRQCKRDQVILGQFLKRVAIHPGVESRRQARVNALRNRGPRQANSPGREQLPGIGLMTPDQVHYGQANAVHAARQQTLELAFQANPERFVNKPPTPPDKPTAAWINPPMPNSRT